MQKAEAEEYLGKNIRLILSNDFKFSGKVIDLLDRELVIIDKFGSRVTIKYADIMVLSEVSNNGNF